MSYEIVKNIRIVPNPENKSEYILVCTSASSNCHPYYFEEWTYGKGKGYTKVSMEKYVLRQFYSGNLQKGNSTYAKFTKNVCNWYNTPDIAEFEEYKKLNRVIDKLVTTLYGRYHTKKGSKRYEEISTLCSKLVERKTKVLEDTLYTLFHSAKYSKFKSNKIAPFIIHDIKKGGYVRQINKKTYYGCSQPHIFTSSSTYQKAMECPKNFKVEMV